MPTKANSCSGSRRSWYLALFGLLWLTLGLSASARVLDDFNDNGKTAWSDFLFPIGVEYATITESGGQFSFALQAVGQPIFAASTKTSPTFSLQEGRTVEFRVDLVTGNGPDAFAVLAFIPTASSVSSLAGYGFAKSTTDILITKNSTAYFYNQTPNPAIKNDNVTMVLAMTVKNGSVILHTQVLDKDHKNAVIFDQTVTDTPAKDVLSDGTDDPPGPYLGSGNFVLLCYENNGTTQPTYEVSFDNAETYVTDHAVLDNFNDNQKTDWTDFLFPVGPYATITEGGGQFNFSLAPVGQPIYAASTKTSRTFDLVEGERVEFQTDLVTGNGPDAFAVLAFIPTASSVSSLSGYGFAKSTTDILITKSSTAFFYNQNPTPAVKNDNVTMVLSMTVKGGSVILNARVLDKDNQNAVIFDQTVIDAPAKDVMSDGTDDPAAPYLGSGNFVLLCYEDNGTTQTSYDVTFDNAEVSAPPLAGNTAPILADVLPVEFSSFLPASTTVSFKATDDKPLPDGKISITLNGVPHTTANGLTLGGTSMARTVSRGGLAANVNYTAVLSVQDADGVAISQTIYFDTFTDSDLVVEVEDYNFGSGKFIDAPVVVAEGAGPQGTAYSLQAGTIAVDFNDTRATPNTADTLYRPDDPVRMRHTLDKARARYLAAGGSGAGVYDYDVGDLAAGEWLNYTRTFAAGTYEVYLRESLANMGSGESVLEAVTGDPTQANAATHVLGSFLGLRTGFSYRNFPLTDGAGRSRTVLRLAGQTTLRLRQVTPDPADGARYQNYLVIVPVPDPGKLRPVIGSASPAPGTSVESVVPVINVAIQNRDTQVNKDTIVLKLNRAPVTPSIVSDANGATLAYSIAPLPAPASVNEVEVSFADSDGVFQTNAWSFTLNYLLLSGANAQPAGSGLDRGFALHFVEAAPDAGLANSLDVAEQQLATPSPIASVLNTNTTALVLNFAQNELPADSPYFPYGANFPGIDPADEADPNYLALEALAYFELAAGPYRLGVLSDDGFKLASGATLTDPNAVVLGARSGGTFDGTFDFVAETAGLYSFRFVYYETTGGANVQLFSVNLTSGVRTLLNDANAPAAIKAYRTLQTAPVAPQLTPPHITTGNFTFGFAVQNGVQYDVQIKASLSDVLWQAGPPPVIAGGNATVQVPVSGGAKFIRVVAH